MKKLLLLFVALYTLPSFGQDVVDCKLLSEDYVIWAIEELEDGYLVVSIIDDENYLLQTDENFQIEREVRFADIYPTDSYLQVVDQLEDDKLLIISSSNEALIVDWKNQQLLSADTLQIPENEGQSFRRSQRMGNRYWVMSTARHTPQNGPIEVVNEGYIFDVDTRGIESFSLDFPVAEVSSFKLLSPDSLLCLIREGGEVRHYLLDGNFALRDQHLVQNTSSRFFDQFILSEEEIYVSIEDKVYRGSLGDDFELFFDSEYTINSFIVSTSGDIYLNQFTKTSSIPVFDAETNTISRVSPQGGLVWEYVFEEYNPSHYFIGVIRETENGQIKLTGNKDIETYSPFVGNGFICEVDPTLILSTTFTESVKALTISPNPTSDYLQITTDLDIDTLELWDTRGRLLLQQSGNFRELNLTELPTGTYFIKTHTVSEVWVNKVVKQ